MTPAEDRLQHEQRLQADEIKRLTARVEELEKQITEPKESNTNGNRF